MTTSSPFLWEPRPEPHAPLTVEFDTASETTILTVRGTWTSQLWMATAAILRKCYAEHAEALIIDLTALDDPAAESAPTWVTAQLKAAALDPPMRVALCISPELILADRMARLGANRFLPVFARLQQARVAMANRLPLTDRLVLALRPTGDAPGRACALVEDACHAWELVPLAVPACSIVSELVHNVVVHAGTDLTVVVSRRPIGLTMTVVDRDPRLPELVTPAWPNMPRGFDRGRGLQLVHTTASMWGARPTADGKAVWAFVRSPTALR